MAINDSGTRNQYTATAGQTVFPYTFEIFDKDDIKVQQKVYLTGVTTTLTEGTHYTVSGVDNDAGGNVTLITGAAVSDTITLSRDMALERLTDYQNSGDFLAAEVNSEEDRQWAAIQQIDSKASIGIRPTIDDPILNSTNTELAAPSIRAGKALGFTTTGVLDYLSGTMPVGTFRSYSTLAALVADVANTTIGDTVYLEERSTGNGGGAWWKVVDATTVTENEYDIVTGDATRSFQLVKEYPVKTSQLGIPANYTNQTSSLVSFFDTLGEGTDDLDYYEIPFNTIWDRTTVLASLPIGVTLFDNSGFDYNTAGETVKKFGLADFGSASGSHDMHWSIESSHHPIIELNNHGNAGSTSAALRRSSLLISAGNLQKSGGRLGFRGAAIHQYTKSNTSNYWQWQLRSLAPWVSVNGQYERWITSESVSSGDYRVNGNSHYVAASTGTTGATAPTHTSGTVSDGGVDWTYLDSSDRTIYVIDERGRIGLNASPESNTLELVTSQLDPNSNFNASFKARGASSSASLSLTPTNSGSAAAVQPFLRAQDGVGLRVMNSAGATELMSFGDTKGVSVKEFAMQHTVAADLDATPSVAGVGTLILSNTGATTVTGLDDGDDNQIVRIITTNANTSFTHSSTFMLQGSINVTTPAAYSSITMQKIPTSISSRWVEVARSIK